MQHLNLTALQKFSSIPCLNEAKHILASVHACGKTTFLYSLNVRRLTRPNMLQFKKTRANRKKIFSNVTTYMQHLMCCKNTTKFTYTLQQLKRIKPENTCNRKTLHIQSHSGRTPNLEEGVS